MLQPTIAPRDCKLLLVKFAGVLLQGFSAPDPSVRPLSGSLALRDKTARRVPTIWSPEHAGQKFALVNELGITPAHGLSTILHVTNLTVVLNQTYADTIDASKTLLLNYVALSPAAHICFSDMCALRCSVSDSADLCHA